MSREPSTGAQPSHSDRVAGQPSAEAMPADLAADEPDAGEVLEIAARDGAGQRVDRYLASVLSARLPGLSRTRLQQWLALGAIWSEQRELGPATRLAGYEILCIRPLPREADHSFEPDPIALTILHEDADLLVIDKPAGLVVHPAAGHWRGTLLNGLLHHRAAQAMLPRAGIVHRLDKDTTGLLVVAASERAQVSLVAQLATRTMSRRYLALAEGALAAERLVDAPIGRDPRQRTRMAVVADGTGKPARTRILPLVQGSWQGRVATLVECRLDTGRTHQIRVHARHLGHPLIGDTLYGGPSGPIDRQALHAWRLALDHPDGRGRCEWRSAVPADLQRACEAYGIDPQSSIARADRS